MEREEENPKKNFFEITQNYIYYIVIGTISFVSLVFLPMVGTVDASWNFPTDSAGWIIWIVSKAIMSFVNVMIFHSFIQQAKINIRHNDKFKRATELLYTCKPKTYVPRSPQKFLGTQYSRKAVVLFLTTGLSTVALTMAFLYFNWMVFLSYLFTIVMGVALGILEMLKVQDYWTGEYYDFALKKVREKEAEEKAAKESAEIAARAEEVVEPQEKEIC